MFDFGNANEGQRLVSDTLFVNIPNELPKIELNK